MGASALIMKQAKSLDEITLHYGFFDSPEAAEKFVLANPPPDTCTFMVVPKEKADTIIGMPAEELLKSTWHLWQPRVIWKHDL